MTHLVKFQFLQFLDEQMMDFLFTKVEVWVLFACFFFCFIVVFCLTFTLYQDVLGEKLKPNANL